MALRRKGCVYRQYMQNGAVGGNVPDSTWRRWLKQGKITKERLQELGIQCGRGRRGGTQTIQRNRDNAATAVPVPLGHEVNNSMEENVIQPISASVPCGAEINYDSMDSDDNNELSSVSLASVNSGDQFREHSDLDYGHIVSDESGNQLSSDSSFDISDEDARENKEELSILQSTSIGIDTLNESLVPSLKVSKFETLLMIFHLALRHGFTDVFLEDMLQFVNELVGADAIPKSKFLFHKLFLFTSRPNIHFFCLECKKYLGLSSTFSQNLVVCENCHNSQTVSSLNGGNYFLSLSLRDQIRDVLSRPHTTLISKSQRSHQVISDMVDGKLYQSLMKRGEILSDPNALTISFNTDGSPVFKSGPNSLWPIQFIINEIDPKQRFDAENILVAGLWFSKSKPIMDIFLQPFLNELRDLEKSGIVWKKSNGSVVESPVLALCCCTDSVAKPQVQNIMQFNGNYGCGYCLHPNSPITVVEQVDRRSGFCAAVSDSDENDETVVHRRRKLLRYVSGVECSLRTNKQLRQHMKLAKRTKQVTFGAKGVPLISSLSYFDVVHGFSIDYMHAILLGIVKRLSNLWFNSSSSSEEYYIGRLIDVVDKRLTDISPPTNMRSVRPISDRVHWKANEWRGFLLYFSIPALLNLLPSQYFMHFKKLVSSVYILSQDSIMFEEVDQANKLLQEFVVDYQKLYGEVNMVYNVHLCTHLAKAVSKLGPLWATSAFPFESGNGRLVKLAKGTRGVSTQIARKYLMTMTVTKLLLSNYKAKDSVVNFCSNIVGYKYLKSATKCGDAALLGKESYYRLNNEQKDAFRQCELPVINIIPIFNRGVLNGTVYSAKLTSRQAKFDDSCVRLLDGTFARIELIFKSMAGVESEVPRCLIRKINVATNPSSHMSPHIKQCSLDPFGSLQVIHFKDVKKCLLIFCSDKYYVAEFPNTYEKD